MLYKRTLGGNYLVMKQLSQNKCLYEVIVCCLVSLLVNIENEGVCKAEYNTELNTRGSSQQQHNIHHSPQLLSRTLGIINLLSGIHKYKGSL